MAVKKNNNRADRGANKKSGNSPKLTVDQERKLLAKQLGIRPKTKEFVDLLNADAKLSATEAYIRTHETTNRKTAGDAASKLLKSPAVIGYKDSFVKRAKVRIGQLVDSDNESIALKASQEIIDRNEGKSIQRNETTSRTVEVKLDLSGVRIGAHYIPPAITPPVLPS